MYDPKDERGVPVSSGIPPLVMWSSIACVVLIFVIAGMVLSTSGHGHIWPAADSTNLKL
ncbi:MAG: hypothetical protein NVS3B7_01820 [Candidatus Elarobacter sp.]